MITVEVKIIGAFLMGLLITWVAIPTVNEYQSIKRVYPDTAIERWCDVTEGGALAQGHLGLLFSLRCYESTYEPHPPREQAWWNFSE